MFYLLLGFQVGFRVQGLGDGRLDLGFGVLGISGFGIWLRDSLRVQGPK